MSEYNQDRAPKPAVKQRKSPPKCSEEHKQLLNVYNTVQKTTFNLGEYGTKISEVLSQDAVSDEKIKDILQMCKDILEPLLMMISVTVQALNNRSPNGSISGDSLSVERWSSFENLELTSPIRSRASSATSQSGNSYSSRRNSASYPQNTEKTISESTLTHTKEKPTPPPRPTKTRSKHPIQPSIHESFKTDNTLQSVSSTDDNKENQQPSNTVTYQSLKQVNEQQPHSKQVNPEKPSPAPRSKNLWHKQLKPTLTRDSFGQPTIREYRKPLSSVLSMSGLSARSMPQLNVTFEDDDDDDDRTGDSGMETGSADYALCGQWITPTDKPM